MRVRDPREIDWLYFLEIPDFSTVVATKLHGLRGGICVRCPEVGGPDFRLGLRSEMYFYDCATVWFGSGSESSNVRVNFIRMRRLTFLRKLRKVDSLQLDNRRYTLATSIQSFPPFGRGVYFYYTGDKKYLENYLSRNLANFLLSVDWLRRGLLGYVMHVLLSGKKTQRIVVKLIISGISSGILTKTEDIYYDAR